MGQDIKGFEGLYKIDKMGNVFSLRFKKLMKWNIDRNGYARVPLINKNGLKKYYQIHRLVCINFLENPSNLPCVNHKDSNKLNNNLKNLEWCTYSQNNIHAYKFGNNYKRFGSRNAKSKTILQMNENDEIIKEWESMGMCSKELKIPQSCISLCCNGHRHTTGGFKFKIKGEI